MSPSPTSRPDPYGRVLLVTDFTAGAEAAADRAALLPLGARSGITLLHVLSRRREPQLRRLERHEAQRRMAREVARLSTALKRHGTGSARVHPVLTVGEPWIEIAARSAGADVVVVGREGERGFRALLLGTTAERVIRNAAAPVLIVKRPARAPYRRLLAAIDLSEGSRAVLQGASRLARSGDRALDVVHAYQTAYDSMLLRMGPPGGVADYHRRCRADAQASAAELVENAGMASGVEAVFVRRGEPRTTVLSVARSRRSDLIAVGTHGRTGLGHVLLGSVAEGIIRHATADVLVVRPRPADASISRRGR